MDFINSCYNSINMFQDLRKLAYKHSKVISFLLLGILSRLVFTLFVIHSFDFFNILAIAKSVADTGLVTQGFFVTGEIQLYGKIYYQIMAAWMHILQFIHLIDIRYLFDTKAYTLNNYMPGLFMFSPPLYVLIAIRLFQFLFDGIFLFFFYNSFKLINPKMAPYAVLFWALNPFFMFVSFAQVQSDMAMLCFLMGGIYFCIKAYKKDSVGMDRDIIFALTLLAVGAVIKQVPLLFIPIVLILFTKNLKQLLVYLFSTLFTYWIVYQSWEPDISLIRHFSTFSKESMALFAFNLNGVPVFLLGYLALLLAVFILKDIILRSVFHFIQIIIFLIIIIYVSESNNLLFPQFSIWIMPFLALAMLYDSFYALFFIAPVISYAKTFLFDNDFLVGSLNLTSGPQLANVPKYEEMLQNIMQPTLVLYLIQSIMVVLYLSLVLYMFLYSFRSTLLKRISNISTIFTFKRIILSLFILFIGFFTIDFLIRSQFVTLTSPINRPLEKKTKITTKPLQVEVFNPKSRVITAIDLKLHNEFIRHDDSIIFQFVDADSKQILLSQKINDYIIPDTSDAGKTIMFTLKNSVNSKHFFISISKETDQNDISVYLIEQDSGSNVVISNVFDTYLDPDVADNITKKFTSTSFDISLRGKYPLMSILSTLKHNILMKRSFFLEYATLIVVLFVTMIHFYRIAKKEASYPCSSE